MKVVELGFNELPQGSVIELSGKDLALVKWVRSHMGNPRVDGEDPLEYHQFSVAGRSFTIDSKDQQAVDALMDRANRSSIGVLTLEATEFDRDVLDAAQNPTGEITHVKSFKFLGLTTHAEALSLSKAAGEIAANEAKYAPKEGGISQANLVQALTAALKQAIPAASAPIAEAVVN